MSEEIMIAHCSPTLAGLKTGSLFNCKYDCKAQLEGQIREWNDLLNFRGVEIVLLKEMEGRALIYVYRPCKLEKDMKHEEAQSFLKNCGYSTCNTRECIKHLSTRLCSCEGFPHEIGLFLGYPLEDIKGFIQHKGKNCKCTGCWKVYSNEEDAKKTFEKYKKCTRIYRQKLGEGRPIEKLTIMHH